MRNVSPVGRVSRDSFCSSQVMVSSTDEAYEYFDAQQT